MRWILCFKSESLNERIEEYDRRIEQIAKEVHPEVGTVETGERRGGADCVDVRSNAGRSTPISSQPRYGLLSGDR